MSNESSRLEFGAGGSPRRGSRRGSFASGASFATASLARAGGDRRSRSRSRRARARSARPPPRRGRGRPGRGRVARASRSASPGCASTRRRRWSGPGRQLGERRARLLEHHLDRRGDVLAVKRGHHDPPRTVVVGAVDRQETVAEEWDQVAEARLAPVELLGVLDRDVRVRLGPEHEDRLGVEQAHREDRPVLALEREQDRERVVRDRARARQAEVARPGRELTLGLALDPDVAGDPADRALGDAAVAQEPSTRAGS